MHYPSISFYTLGCRLNQSETAVIQRTFTGGEYRIVNFNEPADVVVINTCTVTENGDADTRRLVHKINRLNPKARIALIGCQAQVQKAKLAEWPNVRWVVGNEKKMDLISIIKNIEKDESPHVITPTIARESFTIPVAGIDPSHTRANIKIQDGCDFFCSFCEIPYARGRARSRVFEDILLETKALVAAGYKEIVVTGINVGTYKHKRRTVIDVINAMEDVNGLERIRISSIEPTTIPKTILTKMAGQSKLCRYLHIPLQSGSNSVLKAMQRKYTIREFSSFIQKVYATVPGICIGTDVIVGFPQEEEKHFQETLESLKALPIHYFHVFSYSQRHMAKSRHLRQPIDPKTIQKRSKILRELSQRKRRLFSQSLIGTRQRVLFEQKKGDYWQGLTDNYVRVHVPSRKDLTNALNYVLLEKVNGAGLIGEMV